MEKSPEQIFDEKYKTEEVKRENMAKQSGNVGENALRAIHLALLFEADRVSKELKTSKRSDKRQKLPKSLHEIIEELKELSDFEWELYECDFDLYAVT